MIQQNINVYAVTKLSTKVLWKIKGTTFKYIQIFQSW